MKPQVFLTSLAALLCALLLVTEQQIVVFNDDETDTNSVDNLLRSENFLTADKTWRAQAQTQAVISWLNIDDGTIQDVDGFPSSKSSKSLSSSNTDNVSNRRTSSTKSRSSSSKGSSDNSSMEGDISPFPDHSFEVPTLKSRSSSSRNASSSPSPSPTPSASPSPTSITTTLPSPSTTTRSSRRKDLAKAAEVKSRIQKKQEEEKERKAPVVAAEMGKVTHSDAAKRPSGKSIESFWLEDVEVFGESDESEILPDDGWTVEELFLPLARQEPGEITPFDGWDWDNGPVLSRHRRDLVPGSGEVVVKMSKVLLGVLTTAQATNGTAENTQLKADIAVALDTYLSSFIANSDFVVEVTSVSAPNITVQADLLFSESDVTLTQIATALVNLDATGNFKVGSSIYAVNEPFLDPNTNAALLPAICFLCAAAETCSQNPDDQSWFCAFNDSRFFPHGPAQGDNTLPKGEEFASAKITIASTIPYGTELLSDLWISVNGIISFGSPFTSFTPEPLPVDNRKLLAVYWSDLDLAPTDTAEVYYQLYTKTSSNTPQEVAVFSLAQNMVVSYTQETAYGPTSVLVVTWDGVPPWPALSSLDERVTFQAIIISDGSSTYVVYIYGQGGMNFDPVLERAVEVGWLSNNLDTRANYYVFDTVIGNTGQLGVWIQELGRVENFRAKCIQFFRDSVPLIPALNFWNRILPRCPCSKQTAQDSFFWLPALNGDSNCYDMFPLYGQLGRRCCYRSDGTGAFENRIPAAGAMQLYTPYYGDLVNHARLDTDPKEWCCTRSDLCSLYYVARPVRKCVRRTTQRGFCFGDPHIATVDNRRYIFNGIGEYTLLEINGVAPDGVATNFVLQGRTCRALASDGNQTDATIWCALAVQNTNGSSISVSVHESGTYMIVYINEQDYTVRFRENPSFSTSDGSLFARRVNGSLTISTPDSIGVSITLVQGLLDFSVEIDEKFKTMPRGLLGNFNDDSTDDFTMPNGTVLSDNSTERQIFEFGLTWTISQEQSLFTYGLGQNTSTFTDASFTPLFLDEVSSALRSEAETVCASTTNLPCIFDYVATRNTDLARSTGTAIDDYDVSEAAASNSPPTINGTLQINATLGQTASISLVATDADNDDIVYIVVDSPGSGTFTPIVNNSNTFEAEYRPDSLNPVSIGLVAQDSNNLQSEVTQIAIVTCSGCNNQGTCDYENVRSTANPYFSVASCACDAPYSGEDCDGDKNGCDTRPCPQGTTCTDIPAAEEAATGVAYNCSDCPVGYLLNLNRTKCEDINECSSTAPCDANAACTNTLGGYFCTCNEGYRKSGANTCRDIDECVENQNQCSQLCENTVGGYSCGCEPGFDLDFTGFNCDKSVVDPCGNLSTGCSYGCRNNSGVAECFCPNGFQLASDNATCQDINECQENLCSQGCLNTNGSYSCFCYAGYRLSTDRLSCDECASNRYGVNCSNTCNCRGRDSNGGCDNVKGCICVPQWTGESCTVDVDECLANPGLCPEDQVCVNTAGGYRCECPSGYQDTYNNGSCYNINECLDVAVHMCPQGCVDNPGSFSCQCRTGYIYTSNNTCQDIDECATGISGCQQLCVNKEGSYNCGCRPGFVLGDDRETCIKRSELCQSYNYNCSFACDVVNDAPVCFCEIGYRLGADGSTCLDNDECASESTNQCSGGCVNIPGSYNCSCPVGQALQNDQRTCAACDDYHWGPNCANECACNPKGSTGCNAITGCVCSVGWAGDRCDQDVDECSYETSACPAFSTCVNNPGSYRCLCNTGFQLNADGVCVDIDECQTSFPCDQNCNNTIGSYICSCEEGFVKAGDRCTDIDECLIPTIHMCEQRCRNTKGGYACECEEGFILDVTNRRSCIAVDATKVCSSGNTCSNLCRVDNGTDVCYCPPGYQLDAATNTNCSDIDECATQSPCDATNGQCNNLDGSFSCSCNAGFRLSADSVTCQACSFYEFGVDCAQTCACNETNTAQCQATNGTCVCLDGWTGVTCSDNVNECQAADSGNCPSNSRCVDSPGSFRCVCDIGFFKSGSLCEPCDATHFGQDCASTCSCVEANTQDCNDTTGVCTCNTGWSGTNCSVDVDECSAATEYCPGPNDTCANFDGYAECPCDSGFYRSLPSDNCQDVNECLDTDLNTCSHPRTCSNTEGSFTCICKDGYLEVGGVCTVNFVQYTVKLTLGYEVSAFSSRIFDNSTAEFRTLALQVQASLFSYGVSLIGQALLSVTVYGFRQGSVITDALIAINREFSDDPPVNATTFIYGLNNVGSLTIDQSQIAISGVTVGSAQSNLDSAAARCDVFNELTTCQSNFECSEVNGIVACREKDDDSNYELIIGLGVGIPLFIVLAIVVAVLVYMYVKRQAKKDIEIQESISSRSQGRDEPFRSVFATQMATKGSWGAPSRMQMYSPDAYSEAGTSESSGEGKLLKSRQTRGGRLDFQDSAWYDNFGASTDRGGRSARDGTSGTGLGAITPRSPRGAPTEGGEPGSNFSWEYMFKLLEPHKDFEIQRPNLSSSPHPTYTPRNKRPDSMA